MLGTMIEGLTIFQCNCLGPDVFLDGNGVVCSTLASVSPVRGQLAFPSDVGGANECRAGFLRAVIGNDHAFYPGDPPNPSDDPPSWYFFPRIQLVPRQRR